MAATPRTQTRAEQALVRATDVVGATSLNRQRVLSEDEYTQALERIIQRDFFPTLELPQQQTQRTDSQHDDDYLDEDVEASVARIREWMEETPGRGKQRQRQQHVRPSMDKTPTDFRLQATPAGYTSRTDRVESQASKESQLPFEAGLSLDEFQARYTSEDNASFAALLEVENIARKSKYAWAYKAEAEANDKSRRAIQARERLVDLGRRLAEGDTEVRLIEGTEPGRPGERLLIEGRQSLPGDKASIEFAKRRIVAAPEKERLLIEAGKEGQGSEVKEKNTDGTADREKQLQLAVQENKLEVNLQRSESRDAGKVQTWPVTTRNNFFFAPDANIPIHKVAQHPLSQARPKTESVDDLGITEPKSIRHGNTRLFGQEELEEAARRAGVPPSPSHSNIAAAINGTPYHGRPSGTPRVQGYSFVDAMPSPGPSVLGDSGISSLMTFGTLASTPVALRDPNASDPAFRVQAVNDAMKEGPFRIPHTPRREVLAHKMASKATKSLQQRQGGPQSAGLGLRRSAATPGTANRSVRGGTPGGWGSTPKEDAVREARRAMQDEGRTPSRDAFLSPAAKNLLGRTTSHQKQTSPFQQSESNANKRFSQDMGSMERYKRAKWDPSPLSR